MDLLFSSGQKKDNGQVNPQLDPDEEDSLPPTVVNLIGTLRTQLDNTHNHSSILANQLNSRTSLLNQQRALFFKEILVLKEQLYQKQQLSEHYESDRFDIFKPTAWLQELLGEEIGPGDDIEMLEAKVKEKVAHIIRESEEEKRALQIQMIELDREKDKTITQMSLLVKQKEKEGDRKLRDQENQQKARIEELHEFYKSEMKKLNEQNEHLQVTQQDLETQQEHEAELRSELTQKEIALSDLQHEYEQLQSYVATLEEENQKKPELEAEEDVKVDVTEENDPGLTEALSTPADLSDATEEEKLRSQVTRLKLREQGVREELNELKTKYELIQMSFSGVEETERKMEEIRELLKQRDDEIAKLKEEVESKEEAAKLTQAIFKASPKKGKDNQWEGEDKETQTEFEVVVVKETEKEKDSNLKNGNNAKGSSEIRRPDETSTKPTSGEEEEDIQVKERSIVSKSRHSLSQHQLKQIQTLVERDKMLISQTAIANWHLLTTGLVQAHVARAKLMAQDPNQSTLNISAVPHLSFFMQRSSTSPPLTPSSTLVQPSPTLKPTNFANVAFLNRIERADEERRDRLVKKRDQLEEQRRDNLTKVMEAITWAGGERTTKPDTDGLFVTSISLGGTMDRSRKSSPVTRGRRTSPNTVSSRRHSPKQGVRAPLLSLSRQMPDSSRRKPKRIVSRYEGGGEGMMSSDEDWTEGEMGNDDWEERSGGRSMRVEEDENEEKEYWEERRRRRRRRVSVDEEERSEQDDRKGRHEERTSRMTNNDEETEQSEYESGPQFSPLETTRSSRPTKQSVQRDKQRRTDRENPNGEERNQSFRLSSNRKTETSPRNSQTPKNVSPTQLSLPVNETLQKGSHSAATDSRSTRNPKPLRHSRDDQQTAEMRRQHSALSEWQSVHSESGFLAEPFTQHRIEPAPQSGGVLAVSSSPSRKGDSPARKSQHHRNGLAPSFPARPHPNQMRMSDTLPSTRQSSVVETSEERVVGPSVDVNELFASRNFNNTLPMRTGGRQTNRQLETDRERREVHSKSPEQDRRGRPNIIEINSEVLAVPDNGKRQVGGKIERRNRPLPVDARNADRKDVDLWEMHGREERDGREHLQVSPLNKDTPRRSTDFDTARYETYFVQDDSVLLQTRRSDSSPETVVRLRIGQQKETERPLVSSRHFRSSAERNRRRHDGERKMRSQREEERRERRERMEEERNHLKRTRGYYTTVQAPERTEFALPHLSSTKVMVFDGD
ncbi:hypothetical protein BLNAU_2301 [Blattamonas nauphoetae]|uniref:Uncharacterized protein n=1 Tax=Blattamonas nauphoetae TaxID=2049346 RepID=A0ABQ9YGG7_9EUKA|nr:hypothetical protein BLNAU_2301 [Blattamonas nauphoetae]